MNTKTYTATARELLKNKFQFLTLGAPGLGKTKIIEQLAEELDYDLIIMHPVVFDPTDLKGVPAIVRGVEDGEGGYTETRAEFLPTAQLRKLLDADKPTICFLDDIGQASKGVHAALMQLIMQREINGHRISDHVVFTAASNRKKDKAGVTGMITPLISRFKTRLKIEADVNSWTEWAYENEIAPEVISFVNWKPDMLHSFDPNYQDADGETMSNQPSPRTIEAVSDLFKVGLKSHEVLEGAVGEAFATEFLSFVEMIETLGSIPRKIATGGSVTLDDLESSSPSILFALTQCLTQMTEKHFVNIAKWVHRELPTEYQAKYITDCEKRFPECTEQEGYTDLAIVANGLVNG
jgi:hypothetical protein